MAPLARYRPGAGPTSITGGSAGISRRGNPGIDAEIRRCDHAVPVESGGNAFYSLAAGGKESRDDKNDHQCAECHRVAQR